MQSVLLCILDGWGVKKGGDYDAITQAKTPNFDSFLKSYPNSSVKTYGRAVGLPEGQMGNSEVGHMNIGGGRIIAGSLGKIDNGVAYDTLKNHPIIANSVANLKKNNSQIHIMGLASDGGVHSHIDHIIYMAKSYAEAGVNVKMHLFTDGRDTSPKSAEKYISSLIEKLKPYKNIELATLGGRFYGMDRDNRWERVEAAYNAIVNAKAENSFSNAIDYIKNSYANDVTDEFIKPATNQSYKGFQAGDSILMCNFRADRVREILTAIVEENFDGFNRTKPIISESIGMVEYSEKLNQKLQTIFPSESVKNTLGEVISANNLKQLRISETEKYAHITFFFNGGAESVFKGEERILVPSPKVATYDLKPEMSAYQVTEKLVEAIKSKEFSLIVCNFANGDMVGHTGVLPAAIKAVEVLDECLGKLKKAIDETGMAMIITADHGNVEEMLDENGQPHTQHTVGSVPFIIVNSNKNISVIKDGSLCDIAPTILKLMDTPQPEEMTGKALF
ncbi:MAG: 2,3-bisphosphoglycerate-independent phosphoglycerate mutase [Rickettsiales bacterium]|nr:2,3-bisphosphoglycerate-independent phosphoglycerate mutase [Rickettsiales bacterium]